MKKYCTPIIILFIVMGFVHCKKDDSPEKEKKAFVVTVAGSGEVGYQDSTVAHAKFSRPFDVAVHTDGTLYVADIDNHRIRRVGIDGRVSTWAGNSSVAVVNGQGINASFKSPLRIAIDAAGNTYIADASDPRIRKINTTADVSTYAGTDMAGFADGTVANARFSVCFGIMADEQGNLWLSDTYNNRIRHINTTGLVTTLAGEVQGFADSTSALAKFNYPFGVARDRQGNLYVADYYNRRIRKITTAGIVSTLAGSGVQGLKDGIGAEAEFKELKDMVADAKGNLYVVDEHRIRKITPAGKVTTIAGSQGSGYVDGDGSIAKFAIPEGLAIDASGNIYVADQYNHRIRKIRFE